MGVTTMGLSTRTTKIKQRQSPLPARDGGAQQRDLPRYAGAIDQLASNHVVRTIQYQIDRHSIRLQKRRPVLLPQGRHRLDGDLRV